MLVECYKKFKGKFHYYVNAHCRIYLTNQATWTYFFFENTNYYLPLAKVWKLSQYNTSKLSNNSKVLNKSWKVLFLSFYKCYHGIKLSNPKLSANLAQKDDQQNDHLLECICCKKSSISLSSLILFFISISFCTRVPRFLGLPAFISSDFLKKIIFNSRH